MNSHMLQNLISVLHLNAFFLSDAAEVIQDVASQSLSPSANPFGLGHPPGAHRSIESLFTSLPEGTW